MQKQAVFFSSAVNASKYESNDPYELAENSKSQTTCLTYKLRTTGIVANLEVKVLTLAVNRFEVLN